MALLALVTGGVVALTGVDRRGALLRFSSLLVSGPLMVPPPPATAAEDLIDVYFGVGCFWHVQHEMVAAEKRYLNRKDDELTAIAGYAGGLKVGSDPSRPDKPSLVCYHNYQRIADYGRLGHGEVVGRFLVYSR